METVTEEVCKAGLLPLRKEETEAMSRKAKTIHTERQAYTRMDPCTHSYTCALYLSHIYRFFLDVML